MGNLEQVLLEDLPFEYNEEGECMYCGNIREVENQNLILMEQVKKMLDMKDLLNSIEGTLSQIITDMKYGISNQEIKETLTEVLVVISESLKEE